MDEFESPRDERRKTCLKPYLSPEAALRLKEHKYSGIDDGISQKYCWNPLAGYLVTLLPDSVAPNTLTLLGFVHAIGPPIMLYSLFGTQLIGDVPSWFIFLQCYAYLTYRILDEMDGKQARRTGNSSPLGLIFDHGCDCFAAGIQPMIFMRLIQVGNNLTAYVFMIGLYSAFHFTTLEEYYTGTLYLGPCNGVSDGSFVIVVASFITGIVGNNFWATPIYEI